MCIYREQQLVLSDLLLMQILSSFTALYTAVDNIIASTLINGYLALILILAPAIK